MWSIIAYDKIYLAVWNIHRLKSSLLDSSSPKLLKENPVTTDKGTSNGENDNCNNTTAKVEYISPPSYQQAVGILPGIQQYENSSDSDTSDSSGLDDYVFQDACTDLLGRPRKNVKVVYKDNV